MLFARIEFTQYGRESAEKFVKDVDIACRKAAILAVTQYRRLVPERTPGGDSSPNAISGFRDVEVGHMTASERPHLADVLRRPSMSMLRKVGHTWWGLFGERSTLDKLVPRYWRRPWDAANPDRYETRPVTIPRPAIWAIVEFGTGEHSIRPRSDRRSLRFRDRASGEIVFAGGVRHPGAFRNYTGSWGALAAGKQVGRMIGSLPGRLEPFGAAPFRRSQFVVVQRGTRMLNQYMPPRRKVF
jgi:hypothetical protein